MLAPSHLLSDLSAGRFSRIVVFVNTIDTIRSTSARPVLEAYSRDEKKKHDYYKID